MKNETLFARTLRRVGPLALAFTMCCLGAAASALDMSPLKGVAWGDGNRNLVVILHGDGGPGRYDGYANALAKAARGTTVVTLTRPGFRGKAGRSPGGNSQKDHYTRRNNKLLAQSLANMKKSLGTKRLIVVGHSGGSAQLGTVIGAYPGIVDVAILAACPCDVPRWRIHRRGQNNWRQSQSPHKFAGKIPASTRVYAVTFQKDHNTRPRFAETYYKIARSAGVKMTLEVPRGGSHSWNDYMSPVDKYIRLSLR